MAKLYAVFSSIRVAPLSDACFWRGRNDAASNGKLLRRTSTIPNAMFPGTALVGETAPEPLAIRGYSLVKKGQRELVFDRPGAYVVDDTVVAH